MGDTNIAIKIPSTIAVFLNSGTPVEERIKGVAASDALTAKDRVLLLFCMTKDREDQIRRAALDRFRQLSESDVIEYLAQTEAVPSIVNAIVNYVPKTPAIITALLARQTSMGTVAALQQQPATAGDGQEQPAAEPVQQSIAPDVLHKDAGGSDEPDKVSGNDAAGTEALTGMMDESSELNDLEPETDEPDSSQQESEDAEETEVSEETEEYLSKYKMVQIMGISEKIKMALTGDKEWRSILIKDANKLVSSGVIKNPRITEAEIKNIIKSSIQNDEIIRLICANKEWVKHYQIRKALLENNRTPLQNALRYLATMTEKDLAGYAKSKNISSVIATQARRLLLNKKR